MRHVLMFSSLLTFLRYHLNSTVFFWFHYQIDIDSMHKLIFQIVLLSSPLQVFFFFPQKRYKHFIFGLR